MVLRRISYILFLCLFGYGFFLYAESRFFKRASHQICRHVGDNYYEDNDKLRAWEKRCHQGVSRIPIWWSKKTVITALQRQLDEMGSSHLEIWTPRDMSVVWKGISVDTGIKTLWIDSYHIVTEIIADSPASAFDIRPGDELIAINNKDVVSEDQIRTTHGTFSFWRDGVTRDFKIEPKNIDLQDNPSVVSLDPVRYKVQRIGILKLPSFAQHYFGVNDWVPVAKDLTPYDKVIVDLRGNTGGDFVAMLRVLSSFFCTPTDVGYLKRPREKISSTGAFEDILNTEEQIRVLNSSSVVELQTFDDYPCYDGDVNVLVDHDTGSVAEIFATAIRQRKGTHIYGEPTSGDVLLAIFSPTSFGKDYTVSVPAALYLTVDDKILEGKGVVPDESLEVDLSSWRNGMDSWLLKAAKN